MSERQCGWKIFGNKNDIFRQNHAWEGDGVDYKGVRGGIRKDSYK